MLAKRSGCADDCRDFGDDFFSCSFVDFLRLQFVLDALPALQVGDDAARGGVRPVCRRRWLSARCVPPVVGFVKRVSVCMSDVLFRCHRKFVANQSLERTRVLPPLRIGPRGARVAQLHVGRKVFLWIYESHMHVIGRFFHIIHTTWPKTVLQAHFLEFSTKTS